MKEEREKGPRNTQQQYRTALQRKASLLFYIQHVSSNQNYKNIYFHVSCCQGKLVELPKTFYKTYCADYVVS